MRDRARSGPPPTYSANQAAALLEVPANTIRKWRRTGRAAAAGQAPRAGRRRVPLHPRRACDRWPRPTTQDGGARSEPVTDPRTHRRSPRRPGSAEPRDVSARR
ncbi:hypothetical protein G5V59_26880 [Nocardioides sp. W3-2-3]|uniref:helix-turn-helix domain-containing protein n=1 Tax=Nocardioides convexus TaxID=2712224 RepID=UPI002418405A|nr:helix-turn-helix domain-containing protein [Nocardioides convexus]NHA02018.1 hypothetical protein [Nocardioides convexus]